ncbi:probable lipase at C-terminar half [Coccomyxa sp. Obi]|nr:probable lipase at C-terminar half [Coccomyxa sp. Obi]
MALVAADHSRLDSARAGGSPELTKAETYSDRLPVDTFSPPLTLQIDGTGSDVQSLQQITANQLQESQLQSQTPWPQRAAEQRVSRCTGGMLANGASCPPPSADGAHIPDPLPAGSTAVNDDRSGRVRSINADVSDALLSSKGRGKEGEPMYAQGAAWDVEAGREADGASSDASSDEEVDFMGGFSVNSSFDPNVDVVLRFEFESARQLRITSALVLLALLVGIGSFVILLIISRGNVGDSSLFSSSFLEYMNLIAAAVIIALTAIVVSHFTYRRIMVRTRNMRWSPRRLTMCRIYWLQGIAMLIQEVTWLAPNAWTLSHKCAWFGKFVAICGIIRWSTLNLMMILFVITGHNTNPWADKKGRLLGGRADAIVLDAPQWKTHSPKLILWVIFEIPYILELKDIFSPFYAEKRYITSADGGDCRTWQYDCSPPVFTRVATFTGGVFMTVYLLMYIYYLHRGFVLLRSRPYNSFRVGNVLVRLQVVIAALVIADCISFMPGNPHTGDDPILQARFMLVICLIPTASICLITVAKLLDKVWLQQFAWTEEEKPGRLAERAARPAATAAAGALSAEPMFCFETALKALYWSTLVYRYDEKSPDLTRDKPSPGDGPAQPRFTPQAGMGMFGLQQVQLFWERSLDTKVLIGWSERTIVISFRGTASFRNAIADLQAWRVAHPPRRGHWWLASLPLVHSGFYYSWTANGLNRRVIAHVQEIVAASGLKAGNIRVLLTGHSLGGALAALAAHDLVTHCGLTSCQVYTFGAPRPGNRAFKREYDQLVPDTWHIINDADAVPRVGKFVALFARPGQRVIVDYRGDVVVRPSPHEIHIRNGSNPGHHFLASYRRALMGICQAQFTSKALKGGHEAILRLAQQPELRVFLAACGLPPDTLRRLSVAAAMRRTESARARLLRRTESSAAVPWKRGSTNASFHGYGAQPSVMLDRIGSRHQPPLSWRRNSASTTATAPAVSFEEGGVAVNEASQAVTGTMPVAAGTPSETVPSTPRPGTAGCASAAGPPETPLKQGEILARGAGTPSRSSPSIRSLASSPMHRWGRRPNAAASPTSLATRRSIDTQPLAPRPHAPLRRAITEAPQSFARAVADVQGVDAPAAGPPLPDWQGSWQRLQGETSEQEVSYRAQNRPAAANLPPSPFGDVGEQETDRTPAAAPADAPWRPPRPSAAASPPASAPATPRTGRSGPPAGSGASPRKAAKFGSPPPSNMSTSPQRPPHGIKPAFSGGAHLTSALPIPPPQQRPGDIRTSANSAPQSVAQSPQRPALLPRHSTGGVFFSTLPRAEDVAMRRRSAAFDRSPEALPPLAVRTSVILGDPPPPAPPQSPRWSLPGTPRQRPPLLRQRTVGPWLPSQASGASGGESGGPSLLQRATRSLGGRTSLRQHDIQAILQELQDEEARGVEGSISGGGRASVEPAAERRERATISARLENAVVPELGALAARCSRLVGQASLVFGIRTDPDEEMTDIAHVLQELEDAKLEHDAAWSDQPTS